MSSKPQDREEVDAADTATTFQPRPAFLEGLGLATVALVVLLVIAAFFFREAMRRFLDRW